MPELTRVRPKMIALMLAVWIAVAMPGQAFAQAEIKKAAPPPPKILIVSPAAVPIPALKYRLLPSSADLNPGDAAPIYLRAHGYDDRPLDEAWNQIGEKSAQWQDLPLKDFPVVEVRSLVDLWSRKLKQIEFGTRRKTCDWNYTLPEERLNAIGILLPDVQSMRQWGRILALKARVEVAEGKYDDATRTLETGLAFGRHVAEGPFLINGLIGIAISNLMLEPLEDLIAQTGAPNLYWALTALPQPLISLRDALETEQKLPENLIPELTETEFNRSRTAAEWSVLVSRMHEGIVKWCRNLGSSGDGTPGIQIVAKWDLATFKTEALRTARDILKTSRKLTDGQLAEMTDDQLVALSIFEAYRSLQDVHFKAAYLPAREALPRLVDAEMGANIIKPGPQSLFTAISPSLRPAMMAELRLDRRIAALRVIEAVRLFAVDHGGAMPSSLNQITAVSVPDDPSSGKPFDYICTENSAILASSTSVLPLSHRASYRIAIRH
jgi:hypothetical protein